MKTYKHLWEYYLSDFNIAYSIQRSSLGKRQRKAVKQYYDNIPEAIPKVRMYATNYKNAYHTPKQIYDGIQRKKRTIIVPKYYEQIVHHMVMNTLIPMFQHGMYEHSYGSLPNRGAHKGKKAIEKWIRQDSKNCKYCLKMDVRKFFDSIPHDILKDKLSRKIKDERFLKVVFEIIDVQEVGIPLGFYTSQWIANWYLQDLDHYIKEDLGAVHYIRYMDDMVIFGSNKRKLHEMRRKIEEYLHTLGLEMKGNWQVFRFSYKRGGGEYGRCLDFMGFKFYRDRTVLRKGILHKARRKAERMSKKGKPTIYDCRQLTSYLGWIDCSDTYGFYRKYIKPCVVIRKVKKRIGNYDRRISLCGKNQNQQQDQQQSGAIMAQYMSVKMLQQR